MKILIVTSGINPTSGGPTRSCKGLCRSLAQTGEDVTLYVIHGHHPFENPCGVKVIYAVDTPLYTYTSNLRLFDLVHLQGLWDWQLHKIAVACRRVHIPYIISPRGMLDPWALSVKKWKKRIALLVYQRHDLKKAIALHVTAEMERDHVQALGFTQPCIIAPNGVELPASLPPKKSQTNSIVNHNLQPQPKIAIFLSRLHPGKGLLALAEAWARVKPQNWIMKVVGPDSYGHKAEVLAKLDSLGIPHSDSQTDQHHSSTSTLNFNSNSSLLTFASYWQFVDALDDVQKWNAYRSADILIHPSVSENFGITIAEGLYAELPVIATKGTPWKDLVDYNCGWWIDLPEKKVGGDSRWTVDWPALDNALREAFTSSTLLHGQQINLRQMGENGHKLILEKYTWPAIAQTMIDGYKKILENRPRK